MVDANADNFRSLMFSVKLMTRCSMLGTLLILALSATRVTSGLAYEVLVGKKDNESLTHHALIRGGTLDVESKNSIQPKGSIDNDSVTFDVATSIRKNRTDLTGASFPSPRDQQRRTSVGDIGEWVQMGQDVSIGSHRWYEMVAISRDGNHIVVSESIRGPIRAFQWNPSNSTWKKMGSTIEGDKDSHSSVVAMSSNGMYLVIAGRETVRVFKWHNQIWEQVGESIDMWAGSRRFFGAVSMSDDGRTIAVALLVYRRVPGAVKIFNWNGSQWKEKGHLIESLDSQGNYGLFGNSIALSGSGQQLAIGFPSALKSGKVVGKGQVFERHGSSWIQKGNDIYGKGKDYGFGTSIDMSRDGNRIVLGEKRHRESGYARVVEWDGSKYWTNVGNYIEGEQNDDFGESVSISSDGGRIVVGARDFDEMVGPSGAGFARMFDFDGISWLQLGNGLYGNKKFSGFGGGGVSMAGSGDRVAIFAAHDIRVYNFIEQAVGAFVVTINIKPFKQNNNIKIRRTHKDETVSVGIYITGDFDARKVDLSSIRFGPDKAKPVSWLKKDIDNNGSKDIIILRFKLHHAGFSPGRQQACVHGKHKSGVEFKGCRIIRVTKTNYVGLL